MRVLIGWCWFAAAVLVVSLLVHASTFLGIDPMTRWPGVMFIHLAIFPPFIAAICYANRTGGPAQGGQDRVINSAPRWLRVLAGVFFAYALVNFGAFMVLNEGGGPTERDGKYFLTSHGKVLRELSEAEYHRKRAYEVRGFSGHWMLFSSVSLMFFVGAVRLRRAAGVRGSAPAPPNGSAAAPAVPAAVGEPLEAGDDVKPPPEPTTVRAGLASLAIYVACLAMVLSGRPALAAAAVLPVAVAMVLAVRRRRGFPRRGFESRIGCLAVLPNALIAAWTGRMAAEFVYLAVFLGSGAAWDHDVAVTFPREGPSQLSNGEPLDNRAWSALMLLVEFPVFAVGTIGLTYLAEQVGRLVEVRHGETDPGPRP